MRKENIEKLRKPNCTKPKIDLRSMIRPFPPLVFVKCFSYYMLTYNSIKHIKIVFSFINYIIRVY